MNQIEFCALNLPASCPFNIQEIQVNGVTNSNTYLIRERDQYGEFPHIYAKICGVSRSNPPSRNFVARTYVNSFWLNGREIENELEESYKVIVLSDTGCGTEIPNSSFSSRFNNVDDGNETSCTARPQPEVWNIRTFLEYAINPGGRIPYLVMTTHCHYDHIMGFAKLPPTSRTESSSGRPLTTVLTSSHAKSFITPYSELQKHSLCDTINLQAPEYDVGIWAEDVSRVEYTHLNTNPTSALVQIPTPLTILHTPGHTPDSLSWYDADLRLLCVGDSFYVKETQTTRGPKWGSEPPMPVMFNLESNLAEWWESLNKVLKFVRARNAETESEGKGELENEVAAKMERLRCKVQDQVEEEEDEGFVLIDAQDASNEKERSSILPPSPSLPLSQKMTPTPNGTRASTAVPRSQKQTGFDIPPPDQRGIMALPTTSTHTLLKPTPTHTATIPRAIHEARHFNVSDLTTKYNHSDPWMLVVNRWPVPHPPPRRPPCPDPSSSQASKPRPSINKKTLPRVKLCAAHTTLSVDAEWAILSIRQFVLRLLSRDVPCKRVQNGPRGDERWLWDYELESQTPRKVGRDGYIGRGMRPVAWSSDLKGAIPGAWGEDEVGGRGPGQLRYSFSVLAPLSVIEEGRRKILGMSGRGPAGVV